MFRQFVFLTLPQSWEPVFSLLDTHKQQNSKQIQCSVPTPSFFNFLTSEIYLVSDKTFKIDSKISIHFLLWDYYRTEISNRDFISQWRYQVGKKKTEVFFSHPCSLKINDYSLIWPWKVTCYRSMISKPVSMRRQGVRVPLI